jgi:excisionase family DNA binding protein
MTADTKPKPLFIKVSEAAQLLRISRAQAYVLVKRGHIPHTLIGAGIRIPLAALEAMAARAMEEPDTQS